MAPKQNKSEPMKTKLITALRQAAKAIENGTFDYNWKYRGQCNCGAVASCLTGMCSDDIEISLPRDLAQWKNIVGRLCPVTGMPNNKILIAMMQAGMTTKDIVDLEWLRNKSVLAAMPRFEETKVTKPTFVASLFGAKPIERRVAVEVPRHNNAAYVAAYMRTWAGLLVKEGQDDVPASNPAELQEA